MDPSTTTSSQSLLGQSQQTLLADNDLQSPQKLGATPLDQQKLEGLITEKLNTFEGVASKQEIRQMMKEVIQEFLQGNSKGSPPSQAQASSLASANQMPADTPSSLAKPLQGPPPQIEDGALSAQKAFLDMADKPSNLAKPLQGPSPQIEDGALSAQKAFLDMADKPSNALLSKEHGPKADSGNEPLNPFSQGGMGMPQVAQNPVANSAIPQTVQVSRDAAQMIADIANQIVDRIQVNTNSLNNMQEVRISFGNNILPNTDVLINLTGNQLNITFVAGSQQAAQFLSQSNISQLQNTLKSKLGDDKTINVSLKADEGDNAAQGTLTDQAVMRREQADDASSF
jgi:hypothetical protein